MKVRCKVFLKNRKLGFVHPGVYSDPLPPALQVEVDAGADTVVIEDEDTPGTAVAAPAVAAPAATGPVTLADPADPGPEPPAPAALPVSEEQIREIMSRQFDRPPVGTYVPDVDKGEYSAPNWGQLVGRGSKKCKDIMKRQFEF